MAYCKEVVFLDPPTGYMTGRDYNQPRRCRRKAGPNGYCWQHQPYVRPRRREIANEGEAALPRVGGTTSQLGYWDKKAVLETVLDCRCQLPPHHTFVGQNPAAGGS